MSTESGAKPAPWHSIFPTPSSKPSLVSAEELKEWMGTMVLGEEVLVVDARRTDFENICIKGALNLPAHSFYQTIDGITKILSPIKQVVFHCNSCSEGGRGPRTAGWYADELKKRGITASSAYILVGGIKRWSELYGEDEKLTIKLPNLS